MPRIDDKDKKKRPSGEKSKTGNEGYGMSYGAANSAGIYPNGGRIVPGNGMSRGAKNGSRQEGGEYLKPKTKKSNTESIQRAAQSYLNYKRAQRG